MTLVWIAPASVALVGIVVVGAVVRRVVEELLGLRGEMARFAELRPALVEVRELSAGLRSRSAAPR